MINDAYSRIPITEYDRILEIVTSYEGDYVIIHDVDFRPEGAKLLVEVEEKYGVKSVFCLRPHQDYFLTWLEYFRNLSRYGWEIGFHFNSLSRADGDETRAREYFNASLCYLRSFFEVRICHGHGDTQYRLDVVNRMDPGFLESLNIVELEAENYDSYIGDTNKVLRISAEINGSLFVNIHADWW